MENNSMLFEPKDWILLGTFVLTILTVSGGGLWALISKLDKNKASMDAEIDILRTAAFTEYKEIRRDVDSRFSSAYRELGEAPHAIREKVNQVELWMRDRLEHFLPRREYEKDHDRLLETLHHIQETIEMRFSALSKSLEDDRRSRESRDV